MLVAGGNGRVGEDGGNGGPGREAHGPVIAIEIATGSPSRTPNRDVKRNVHLIPMTQMSNAYGIVPDDECYITYASSFNSIFQNLFHLIL